MARTVEMRLVELMCLKQDVSNVIENLGKKGVFQFQETKRDPKNSPDKTENIDRRFLDELQSASIFLGIEELGDIIIDSPRATDEDRDQVVKILASISELHSKIEEIETEQKKVSEAYREASAFSNLQVSYEELEHLSFLSLRIGKVPFSNLPALKEALADTAIIVSLGEDSSSILAATSKKGRFALDTELKKAGFVDIQVPKDFKGVPQDALDGLKEKLSQIDQKINELEEEKNNFAETHKEKIIALLKAFSVGAQIIDVESNLESTSMVYRLTGWIPASQSQKFMKEIDELTEGRTAIREYLPSEVSSVINGTEKVPVKLSHGPIVKSFERMIFSYGSPLYRSIDPTPFVAVFFTILFGIMFGDMGQGLVFLVMGILMALNIIKVGGWNKFAPIFMCIGISSSVMGLITGEFFATEKILEPFALWVTGLFGTPHAPIVKMMPSSDPNSIKVIFGIFGVTIGLGFVINSIGLVVNLLNKIRQKKWGSALFGKTGLAGLLFFWYAVFFALRLAFFKSSPHLADWIIIGVTLFFASFGEPFERLLDGERPVLENGLGSMVIGGVVELIEVISTYLSSSISFVRVGAFALAHAVLGFIIHLMAGMVGPVGGVFVYIIGNAIVVVLEGMIVAIQVIRLQYYEFFSKFFGETGSEFKPFQFCYGK